jgi:hypothetical protein
MNEEDLERGNSSVNSSVTDLAFLDENSSVFYEFVKKDLISNQVVSEEKYKAILRKFILGLAAPVGFAGNWLYWKWSWDYVFKNLPDDTPDEFKVFLAVLFIIGNGTTNGILTTKPLIGLLNDLLRPYSKEEKAIYHSEIHTAIRSFYTLLGFILSVGGQISPAYMVYYQNQILALAILLIASNMGYTWQSFYQMFCDWHVRRKLTPQEQQIEAAKGNFKTYLLSIQNDIIRYQKNKNAGHGIQAGDVITLINELGKRVGAPHDLDSTLSVLYNFKPMSIAIDPNLPGPLSLTEERLIYVSAKVLLGFFMMHYWYGGGDAGRELVGKDSKGADAAFYFFATFSIACVIYLSNIYMHGSTHGVYTSAKNLFQDKEVPDLAKALFPRATCAWNIFAISTTLLSWAFGARFVQEAFPDYLKLSSLTIGVVAIIFLLGFSMIAITKPAVFWLMKNLGLATEEELKIMTTDEKLDRLAHVTGIAHHDVFADFIKEVMELFPFNRPVQQSSTVKIEEVSDSSNPTVTDHIVLNYGTLLSDPTDSRFGITSDDIDSYFSAHPKKIVATQWKSNTNGSHTYSETSSVSSVESLEIGSPQNRRSRKGKQKRTPGSAWPSCTIF